MGNGSGQSLGYEVIKLGIRHPRKKEKILWFFACLVSIQWRTNRFLHSVQLQSRSSNVLWGVGTAVRYSSGFYALHFAMQIARNGSKHGIWQCMSYQFTCAKTIWIATNVINVVNCKKCDQSHEFQRWDDSRGKLKSAGYVKGRTTRGLLLSVEFRTYPL